MRWERDASAVLGAAMTQIRLLGCVTPINWEQELNALHSDFRAGRERAAHFQYAPRNLDRLASHLEAVASSLTRDEPIADLYSARAQELAIEARMCGAAGSDRLAELAARRYQTRTADREQADELATSWLRDAEAESDTATILSDDESDPRSLLCRMRCELGRRRIGMRVIVSPRLSALAATGADAVYVAANRLMTSAQIERTVIHEIEGHAMVRVRARKEPLGLFTVGSAGGSDQQEGRALLIEKRQGHLGRERRRELALRHHAASLATTGADNIETVRSLRDRGAPLAQALRVTMRIMRGGGLARERVYLPSLLRVQAAYAADPALETMMTRGNLSIHAANVLRQHEQHGTGIRM